MHNKMEMNDDLCIMRIMITEVGCRNNKARHHHFFHIFFVLSYLPHRAKSIAPVVQSFNLANLQNSTGWNSALSLE